MREAAPLIISLHADLFFEWEQSLQGDWPDANCIIYQVWDQGLFTPETLKVCPCHKCHQFTTKHFGFQGFSEAELHLR